MTGSDGFRILARESLLDLGFLGITKRQIASPDGVLFDRIVIEHPGAVAVVPIRDDTVTLLHQYRAPADQWMLEIPAGKLDVSGEELIPAAQRELLEETGLTGGAYTHLTDLWTAVGFCDEQISIFLAEDPVSGSRSPIGPEEEHARVVEMTLDAALDLVTRREISDAKTVVGLLLASKHRGAS